MQPTNESLAKWLPRLLGLLFLLPVLIVALHPGLRAEVVTGVNLLTEGDLEGLKTWAASFGGWAPFATSCLMVAQALVAPIPAVLVTWTNSLLFGWFPGGCLSIFSATVAASICYWIGRLFGEPLADRLVSEKKRQRWEELTTQYGAKTVLVARLLPFIPFDPISYIAGIVKMRFLPFFVMTLLGQIPAGFAYSWLGSQITKPAKMIIAGVCVVLALVAFGLLMKQILRKKPPSESGPE